MGRVKQLMIEAQEVLDWNHEHVSIQRLSYHKKPEPGPVGLKDDIRYGVECLIREIKELKECEDMAESLYVDWHEKTFARKPRQE